MMRRATVLFASAALIALAACSRDPAAKTDAPESDVVPLPKEAAAPATPGAPPAKGAITGPAATDPATPAGPAVPVQATDDEGTVQAAYVTQVVWVPEIGAKIFSTAGGDPAINGLYTHIAFPPEAPDESFRVFRIGDFESWEVTEKAPGRIVLSVRQSRIDEATGNPVTENKRWIVTWQGELPTSVSVTPAA